MFFITHVKHLWMWVFFTAFLTVGLRTGWSVKKMLNLLVLDWRRVKSAHKQDRQWSNVWVCVWDFFQWVSCDSAHRVYECVGVQQGALLEWEEQPCEDQHHRDASRLLTSCCKSWPLHPTVFFSEYCGTCLINIMFYRSVLHISTIIVCTNSSATPLKPVKKLKKTRWLSMNSCLWVLKWKRGSVPLNSFPLYKHNRLWISPGKRTELSIKVTPCASRIKNNMACLSVSQSGSWFFFAE